MLYRKSHTREISFPLGGIGSGCVGLAGNGRLRDWEIFNAPNKNSLNGYTHFCIRVSHGGKVDFRLLQGDCFVPYTGEYRFRDDRRHHGYGWGVEPEMLAGLPHFREHVFRGEFPVAEVDFSGENEFPVEARLVAWSPFLPGNARDSFMPCAILEYEFKNRSGETVDAAAVGVLANPWTANGHFNTLDGTCLTACSGGDPDTLEFGGLTLALPCEKPAAVSGQEYWYRGGWSDGLEMYLRDLRAGGRFRNRSYATGGETSDHGVLAAHFTLAPGETRRVVFALAWQVPNRENTWNPDARKEAEKQGVPQRWKNYAATVWPDSPAVSRELAERFDLLRSGTFAFHDALFASTLPKAVLDGASACLAVLKSPTCLRLEDGTFYGWEGVGTSWGSCEGSCIHVWNYAQALPFLFPALERSMCEAHLKYSLDDAGGLHFRILLPLGIHANTDFFRPCVDGQFGEIMKFFRDWKISGDDSWLKKWYPALKKMIEYAWSDRNPDRWDPTRSGALTGRQHHTLDMELFGPNAWLGGHYLGALLAASKMADRMGDALFADECRSIYTRGRRAMDALFNGEYFEQKIDLHDPAVLAPWPDAAALYWNNEKNELKYQIANGCEIDNPLPQWFASLFGIGDVFTHEQTLANLRAVWRYNFVECVRDQLNPWRIYSVNDESGVRICVWPDESKKPAIPIPYNTETMHGFEWAFASHLVWNGLTREGEKVAKSIRDRYDGAKRNPWSEIECGGNYARSMAAWGLVPAYLRFRYDAARGFLGFDPVSAKNPFTCFWSLGETFGTFERDGKIIRVRVCAGTFLLKSIALPAARRGFASASLNGQPIAFLPPARKDGEIVFASPVSLNGTLEFTLA